MAHNPCLCPACAPWPAILPLHQRPIPCLLPLLVFPLPWLLRPQHRVFNPPRPSRPRLFPPSCAVPICWARRKRARARPLAFALPLLQQVQAARPARPAEPPARWCWYPRGSWRPRWARCCARWRRHCRQPPPRMAVVFGGVSINPQMMALRGGADVVVATPGRLLDLVRTQRAAPRQGASLLVLDEADRLLDLGFADELQRVLALLPAPAPDPAVLGHFPETSCSSWLSRLLRHPERVEMCGQRPRTRPSSCNAPWRWTPRTPHPAAAPVGDGTRVGARAGVCGHPVRRRASGRQAPQGRDFCITLPRRPQPGRQKAGPAGVQAKALGGGGDHRTWPHAASTSSSCRSW